jgi:hypothetical protein
MITMENYEEYMVMHADGELQPHEEQALQAFLSANPQLQGEMDIYSSIRLAPDPTQAYEHKKSLLKPEGKAMAFPAYRTWAMAAGVAAILVIGAVVALRDGGSNSTGNSQVAAVAPAHTEHTQTIQPTAAPAATVTTTKSEAVAAVEDNTTVTPVNTAKHATSNAGNNSTKAVKQEVKSGNDNDVLVATTRPRQELQNIQTTGMQQLPVSASQPESLPLAATHDVAVNTTSEQNEPNWFDKLPVDEDKKNNINTVATAVANGCEKISAFKKTSLDKIGFSMRVEKKKLIVSF